MDSMSTQHSRTPNISDVNHYDSQVWIRFEDGRSVQLSGEQILQAADRERLDLNATGSEIKALTT